MLNARRVPLCSLVLLAAAVSAIKAGEKLDSSPAAGSADGEVLWRDLTELGIEGKGWPDTKAAYGRLPAKAESMVRGPVWNLSRQSAGLCGRFVTDAPAISVRWSLLSTNLAMPHMAATGVSGVDLYVKTDHGWRWLACGFPKAQSNEVTLVQGLPSAEREYMLYLPLYNGVTKVEVGIPKEHTLAKAPARPTERAKPLLFYGTSITQGGCASRPGMVHTAILGRRLDRPVINLGFSGNGKMEPEIATLLAEIDPAAYVLDCLPNMSSQEVEERVEPFVRTLRAAHPSTPIVLVEDRNYTNGFLIASKRERNEASHAALRAAYDRLVADGVQGLFYLPGKDLLGDDGEATVDSSHPTDLGFVRQAAAFQSVLEQALACQAEPEELTDQAGVVVGEFIYETAPFPECHASTIVETQGMLVAAWFAGTREQHQDVGIWLSRRVDSKWSAPVEVANGAEEKISGGKQVRYPTWNPVLFQPKAGPLLLFYKVGPAPSSWWGMLVTSPDGGKTWSKPRRLPEGILGPIKNKPVELEGGELLCPSSTESADKPSKWQIRFERTHDLGATWETTGPLNDGIEFGAIQPSLLVLPGGKLQAVGRTRQGKVFQIASDDGGKTWGKMTATSLPNPNSGIDAVTLRDGRRLIVYNHTQRGRSPLNVAVSRDGIEWAPALVLENQPGEYSYPAVIQTADGLVHVTYTWQRKRVRHVVIDPAKVAVGSPQGNE